MTRPNVRQLGNEIYWSTTPPNMAVRVDCKSMVHRVLQIISSNVAGDVIELECGSRIARGATYETTDFVDCMACMIRRTSESMEAEWAEQERAEQELKSETAAP